MQMLHEFPHDRIERSVSPQRYAAISQLITSIEQCEEQLSQAERQSPYFKKLAQHHYDTLSTGVGVSTLGRLLGASKNWLEHYRAYTDRSYSASLNYGQRKLIELCRTLDHNFSHLATRSDLIAHEREMKLGKLRLLG